MTSRQEQAIQYAERVRQWVAERDAMVDYMEYERGGKVNRAVLCAELDFGRSVVTQNPAVRESLRSAEVRWYSQTELPGEAHEAARERAETRSVRSERRLSSSQDMVAKLQAENVLLRKRLQKYEALDEILAETGRLPRI